MTLEEAIKYIDKLANRIPLKFFTEEEVKKYDEFAEIVKDTLENEEEIRADERAKTIDDIIILLHKKLYNEPLTTDQRKTNAIISLCIKQVSELKGGTE